MSHSVTGLVAGFIISTISSSGYAGVVGLMAIESACIPLPSEVIMPFSGYLASIGRFDLALLATAGALGCNLGSTLAYWAGRYGGRPLIERWGGYILMSPHELQMSDRFFARFGGIAVFIGRLLPIVRTFISLPAGIARLPQLRFQLYTFFGSWPWCFVLAYIGYKLGERWNSDPRLRSVMHSLDLLIVAAVGLGLVWYLWRHVQNRMRR